MIKYSFPEVHRWRQLAIFLALLDSLHPTSFFHPCTASAAFVHHRPLSIQSDVHCYPKMYTPRKLQLSRPCNLLCQSSSEDNDTSLGNIPENNNNNNNNNNKSDSKEHTLHNTKRRMIPEDGYALSEAQFQREVAIAKAQAEIDAILHGSDIPFDLETELGRVTGGISPPLSIDTPESKIEQRLHEIETSMYSAINTGDYDQAQKKKVELNQLHIDDCGRVLAVNSAFYRSFSEKDYDQMKDIWLHESSALCIHPSHAPIIGARAVLESWKKMFSSGNTLFQRNKMEPTNIRLMVKGTTAVVTCDEEVYTKRFVRGRKRQDGMELVNKLISTNIFRKVGDKWFMVHHHASWHPDSEAAKKALSSQTGGNGSSNKPANLSSSSSSSSSPRMIVRGSQRPLLPGINSNNNNNNPSPESVEGVLGIPGHEGLNGKKRKGNRGDNNSADSPNGEKRIILGSASLSDLLSGGLGDLLGGPMGGKDQGNDDAFIELVDDGDDDEDEDDDEDDDGDDDDDSDEDDIDDDFDNEPGIIISKIGKGELKSSSSRGNGERAIIVSGKRKNQDKGIPKDTIRQNCISALRKLTEQGAISLKQKRVLLTDIIACSAKGEFSMVEVAYELLCGEGEDKNAAEIEFAEQCRIFASSLPEYPPMSQ